MGPALSILGFGWSIPAHQKVRVIQGKSMQEIFDRHRAEQVKKSQTKRLRGKQSLSSRSNVSSDTNFLSVEGGGKNFGHGGAASSACSSSSSSSGGHLSNQVSASPFEFASIATSDLNKSELQFLRDMEHDDSKDV